MIQAIAESLVAVWQTRYASMKFVRNLLIVAVFTCLWLSGVVSAVDFENFTGSISKTRLTNNPSSAGNIDRNHFEFRVHSFSTEWKSTAYLERMVSSVGGDDDVVVNDTLLVDEVEFTKGNLNYLQFAYVHAFEFIGVGMEFENTEQNFENSILFNAKGNTSRDVGATLYNLERTYNVIIGLPLNDLNIGLRYGNRELVNEYDFRQKDGRLFTVFDGSVVDAYKVESTSSFAELGIQVVQPIPHLDWGLVYRPAVEATAKFSGVNRDNFQDFTYSYPGRTLVGFSYLMELSDWFAIQLSADGGVLSLTKRTFNDDSSKDGSETAGLLRFLISPIIDISVGANQTTLANYRFETTTATIQLPLFESTFKMGVKSYNVFREEELLTNVTYPTFSINFQYGPRVRKGLRVPPKLQKIRFIDRL